MPQLPPQRTFTPFAMPGQQQQQAHQAQQPQQPQQAGPVGGDGLDSPGGLTLPPTKRQRLSPPLPPSPAQSSSSPYTNSTIPYQTFPGTTVAASPGPPTPISAPRAQLQSFDMRVRPAQNVMGPPSRPAERLDRSTDLNQLSDIVMASGIDVREEENYLAESYRNQHSSYPSLYTAGQQQHYSAATPGGRFSSTWPHAGHDGLSIIPGAGPYNKPPLSMRTIEEELYDKHKKAARALAENQQYHLRDSFLAANNVRQLMSKRAYENGVIISWKGLEEKTMDTAPPAANGVTMIGADGTGVVSIRKSSTLAESAPLADMLTLLSLAANEKLRDIVEDAFRISRGRQMSSQGVVPPEWSDIAVGDSAPTPTTTLPTAVGGTAWDQLPNGTVPPLGAGTEPSMYPAPPSSLYASCSQLSPKKQLLANCT